MRKASGNKFFSFKPVPDQKPKADTNKKEPAVSEANGVQNPAKAPATSGKEKA